MVPSYGSWLLNICQLPVKMIAGYASSNFPGGRIGSMLFTGWGVPVSTVFVRLAVGDGVAETRVMVVRANLSGLVGWVSQNRMVVE